MTLSMPAMVCSKLPGASVAAIVRSWLRSPGHRAILLDGRYRDLGIGIVGCGGIVQYGHLPAYRQAGLKVVAPATPYDAKGLLLASFEEGNPVLFLEHKGLYRSAKGPVPDGHYTLPLGRARIAREGTDATVVTYGVGVVWAGQAAEALATEGFAVEVIDLRTLLPWDVATVADSVRKTSKALVLHEAPVTGGFGAEIAATIATECFRDLDAPVVRLGGLDMPVPFSKALEEIFMPKARLLESLRGLLTR
jgi:2-oxoisovalerate dehydrogenase E1 component